MGVERRPIHALGAPYYRFASVYEDLGSCGSLTRLRVLFSVPGQRIMMTRVLRWESRKKCLKRKESNGAKFVILGCETHGYCGTGFIKFIKAVAHSRTTGLPPSLKASALAVSLTHLWDSLAVAFARVMTSSILLGDDFSIPASTRLAQVEDFFPVGI